MILGETEQVAPEPALCLEVLMFGATETFGPPSGSWIQWLQVLDGLGFRLCVGSAAVLVGLFVFRRWPGNT
jgi:hypothetical protein